jgi:hypothetical protein
MAEMRRFGLADSLLLLLVLAAAAGARSGYLLAYADGGRDAGPLQVQDAPPPQLEEMIQSFKSGNDLRSKAPLAGASEPTAHAAPGYPWLVGLLSRFVDSADRDRIVRWVQCGLGSLTAVFYFLFARRAFRSLLVGSLAGLFCAVHPFWVLDTAAVADGVTATFLLAFALFLGSRAGQSSGPVASLFYGLTLAALALVRASTLPFAFVALGWFLLRTRSASRGWLWAALGFLGFVIGLGPWTFRNYQQFHEPIPIVDSVYVDLWAGNHAGATGGPAQLAAWGKLPTDDLAKLPEPERYAKLAPRVVEEVRARPVETLRRRLRAGLYFIFGERWFSDDRLADVRPSENPESSPIVDAAPVTLTATLLGLIVLGLLGWRWTYAWRAEALPSSLALIWLPLPYILGHAEALSGPRLPLDGVLLSYAAFAIGCFIPGLAGNLLKGPGPDLVRDDVR